MDNSSAVGWLVKSNFDPDIQSKHDMVARKMAEIILDTEITLHPEHVKGSHNIIADSLSRDIHIPCKQLSFLLCELFPTQTPMVLSIVEDLPDEIICWLGLLKGGKLSGKELPQEPTPSKMGILVNGSASWPAVVSLIRSLKDTATRPNSACSAPFQQLCKEMNMAEDISINFQAKQSDRQSIAYVRPLGKTFTAALCLRRMDNNHC